jgi:hypothetical protein
LYSNFPAALPPHGKLAATLGYGGRGYSFKLSKFWLKIDTLKFG